MRVDLIYFNLFNLTYLTLITLLNMVNQFFSNFLRHLGKVNFKIESVYLNLITEKIIKIFF